MPTTCLAFAAAAEETNGWAADFVLRAWLNFRNSLKSWLIAELTHARSGHGI